MNDDKFLKELKYQTTMCIARQMVSSGLITEEEYTIIETMFLEKYDPCLGQVFSELT